MTSGHWDHYADCMFRFDIEKEPFGLKPMNCPGHCIMFDQKARSYRELPLRMADFGVLHRNELSGALTGLTRVRRFQQDDAHIFCMPEQVKTEMAGALDFLKHVYTIFGFTYQLRLSTRPEKFLGDIAVWDKAEKDLQESLDAAGLPAPSEVQPQLHRRERGEEAPRDDPQGHPRQHREDDGRAHRELWGQVAILDVPEAGHGGPRGRALQWVRQGGGGHAEIQGFLL